MNVNCVNMNEFEWNRNVSVTCRRGCLLHGRLGGVSQRNICKSFTFVSVCVYSLSVSKVGTVRQWQGFNSFLVFYLWIMMIVIYSELGLFYINGMCNDCKWVMVSSSVSSWIQVNVSPSEFKRARVSRVNHGECKWVQLDPIESKCASQCPYDSSESEWVQVRNPIIVIL